MNEVTERVRILVETIAKDTGSLDAVKKKMDALRMRIKKASQALAQHNLEMRKSTTAGTRTAESMNTMKDDANGLKQKVLDLNKKMNPLINRQQKLKRTLKEGAQSMRDLGKKSGGLKMEFLGLMFFGMMLQRTFMSMLKPAMEVFGIFELWQTMLQVLFLPIISQLFPIFLDLIKYFMDLDPAVKLMIGGIIVLGAVIGSILMVVGQLALGIFSLIMVFGEGGLFAGLFTGLLGALPMIGIAIAAALLLWQSDIGGFKDFVTDTFGVLGASIEEIFEGVKKVVSGIWKTLTAILSGDWSTAWEEIQKVAEGLEQIFVGIFQGIVLSIANIFAWLFNMIKDMYNNIVVNGVMFGIESIARKLGANDMADALAQAQKTNVIMNGVKGYDYYTKDDLFSNKFGGEGKFNGSGASGSFDDAGQSSNVNNFYVNGGIETRQSVARLSDEINRQETRNTNGASGSW